MMKNLSTEDSFENQIFKAYSESLSPIILSELKSNFQPLDNLLLELESIVHLLFLNSIFDQNNLKNLSLHMAFSGSFGTGKTSLSLKIAQILRDLKYLTKGHLISASREDLVGQYVGHTAPKTKELLQKAQGGILFIDEASQLYKANNEKDYGSEAIEIILQVMENHRNDLALIFSDDKSKLDLFFQSNPGISSRIAHHFHFPNYLTSDLNFIFPRLLKNEGEFFLSNQELKERVLIQSLLLYEFKKLQKLPTYANIRSLEIFTHKVLTNQAERLYRDTLAEQTEIKAKTLFELQHQDLINF